MVGCQYMKNKSNAGRPTVMTPETVNKLEQAFLIGCTDQEACFFANISKQTLYDYQAKFPEFVDRKEQLKEAVFYDARNTIAKSVKENPQYAFEFMKRKKKDEFSERSELTGKDGTPITPIEVKFLSTEQK